MGAAWAAEPVLHTRRTAGWRGPGGPTRSQRRWKNFGPSARTVRCAPVRRRVDPVAREATGKEGRHGLTGSANAQPGLCVRAVSHGDDDARACPRAGALEQSGEDLRHRSERPCGEIGDRGRRESWCRVPRTPAIRDSRRRALREGDGSHRRRSLDRAVHRVVWDVVWPDAEALSHSRPEALHHDVGSCAERLCERGVDCRSQTTDSLPSRKAVSQAVACRRDRPPGGSTRTMRAPSRRARGSRTRRQVAREVDDERVGQRLHAAERISILASVDYRSIASEDKRTHSRRRNPRVAEHGYHEARVGDIAEDAGVAHGILYHYFASKDDVLRTIFVENWGQLIARFRAVEVANEPAGEKLEGIARSCCEPGATIRRLSPSWFGRSRAATNSRIAVDEVREAFAIVQRIVEEGQAAGVFSTRPGRAPRELALLRWSGRGAHRLGAGSAPRQRGRCRDRRTNRRRRHAARPVRLGSRHGRFQSEL